jgi:hypothetical protein
MKWGWKIHQIIILQNFYSTSIYYPVLPVKQQQDTGGSIFKPIYFGIRY